MTDKKKTIDFEQELYKNFGQVKDFTLGIRIGKYFYELGVQHQEQKDALTWQDMKMIWNFGDELPPMAEEDFYQEMLNQFNKRKKD